MNNNQQDLPGNQRRWTVIGLIVIFSIEFLLRDVFLPRPPDDFYIISATAMEWIVFLLLILYWIPRVEGRDLSSIGFGRFRWRYAGLGALVYIVYLFVSYPSGLVLEQLGLEPIRSLQPMISGYHQGTLIALFLTGTIVEEVFYRGYLISRLAQLSVPRWFAGIISWLLFSLVHLRFFGVGPTLDVSILSGLLVLIFLREDNLWPCIVVHGINGLFAYLLFPLWGG